MGNESTVALSANPTLHASRVYVMAGICLVVGLAIGYVMRGSQPAGPTKEPIARAGTASTSARATAGHAPSMEEMKHVADQQATPLVLKLRSDPRNSALLAQVGAIYHSNHQFETAAAYYKKAVQADPKNVGLRTKLASSLYRSGDVNGAIAELNRALSYDPKDANSLFNLGMIKLQGRQDTKGALTAWQQLLKSNPQLSADRKAEVQKLIAQVMTMQNDQHGIQRARTN
jgi:cytochrome c-type biogenesis protein CcmH/NrfG